MPLPATSSPVTLPEPPPETIIAEPKSTQKTIAARSRLGRPPGRKAGTAGPKEKITVRIDAALLAAYRDWSWEARCQVGELVERALRQYLLRRSA